MNNSKMSRRRVLASQMWAATACAAFAAGAAQAQTTYHVAAPASGGSDANAGTAGAPFATIQRGANAAAPGDTVLVGPGMFGGFNVGAGLTAEGASGALITFRGTRGVGGGNGWLTIISTEAPRFNGTTHHARINIDTASYITLEDFEVVGLPDQRVSKAGIRAAAPATSSSTTSCSTITRFAGASFSMRRRLPRAGSSATTTS